MALPKGIDVAILSDQSSFSDYLEQAMVISLVQKALNDNGFQNVGIVYANNQQRIPIDAIPTIFDVAAKYFPKLLAIPITISTQKSGRLHREIDLVDEDLIIERMHRQADMNARWHLRSHSKSFPL